jgi:hypothetical protein
VNCYYHNDRPAVGLCKNCYRGLCPECAGGTAEGLACPGDCEEALLRLDEMVRRNLSTPTGHIPVLFVGLFLMLSLRGASWPPWGS